MLQFASSTSFIREVKNMSPDLKQIELRCFVLLNVLIWKGRSILSLNFKCFHQTNNLWIVDIAYYNLRQMVGDKFTELTHFMPLVSFYAL